MYPLVIQTIAGYYHVTLTIKYGKSVNYRILFIAQLNTFYNPSLLKISYLENLKSISLFKIITGDTRLWRKEKEEEEEQKEEEGEANWRVAVLDAPRRHGVYNLHTSFGPEEASVVELT